MHPYLIGYGGVLPLIKTGNESEFGDGAGPIWLRVNGWAAEAAGQCGAFGSLLIQKTVSLKAAYTVSNVTVLSFCLSMLILTGMAILLVCLQCVVERFNGYNCDLSPCQLILLCKTRKF